MILQGFYVIKLGGWKNALFQTNNPIPFLKIGATIISEAEEKIGRIYLMNLNLREFCLTTSPYSKMYAKL